MNCQEVMELIQRHVDHDLNERETSLMHDHVGQCPDCKAMLDRLVRLSEGLAQLPRVEPPYSLVDALLPKLDSYEVAGSPQEAVPAPANRRRAASSRRVWIAGISSMAAACVIVAILAFNGSILDQMGIRSKEKMASMPESAASQNLFVSDASSGGAELRATDQSGNPPGEPTTQRTMQDTFVSNKESTPELQGNAMGTGTEGGMGINAFEDPGRSPEGPAIRELSDAVETDSPDGAWRAILAEGILIMYDAKDGQEAYRHDPSPGTISNLVWREDSSALDYTYTDAEGRSAVQSLLVPEMEITTH